ncbi:hypothetical protein [Primorskyibacter sp. S187A]|uniref:hypothetical protein n=1 Tax=Primorskyibacter sp. S187A TaxID=3415130 RepID=UPI003C7C5E3A
MLETIGQGLGIFVIAFLGGLAGAVAKHVFSFLSKRVDHKASSRDTLENLIVETLDEIRELAVGYWSVDECEEQKAAGARLVALCDTVPELYLELFDNDLQTTRDLDIRLNRLSNVITGGTFQQSDRKKDHAVISEMEKHLMSLLVEVRLKKARLPYPWY